MFRVELGDKVIYPVYGGANTGTVVGILRDNEIMVRDDDTGKIRLLHRDSVKLVCNADELASTI